MYICDVDIYNIFIKLNVCMLMYCISLYGLVLDRKKLLYGLLVCGLFVV